MSSWTRPLVGLAALTLALAACGGGASPSATTGGSGSPVTAAPSTPAPSTPGTPAPSDAQPTVAPTTGNQGPNLSGSAAALANLDSYQLKTVMKMQGLQDSMFSIFGDGMVMEGTIILRPSKAADISISMGTEAQKTEMGYRLVGTEAWVRIGDSWMVSTAEDAQSTIDAFSPEKMFGSFESVTGLRAVGDESKNGIATTHYQAPADAVGAALGTSIGLADATWSMDLWVAKEAGYAVSYAVVGKGASGSFEMTLDISKINDQGNKVEKPANVGG